MCEEKELLVSYLYDELAGGDRARFEAHMRACAECRGELKALREVRADLAAWAPPEPDFGFRVVRGGRDAAARDVREAIPTPVQSWRAWWTPAAGFAAAAVLVLAAASAIARVEVRRGPDGVTVRTGWSAFAPAASSAAGGSFGGTASPSAARDARPSSTTDAEFVAGIERRLAALESSASRDSGLRNAASLSARASDAEIIRRVRDLLAQSETRQQDELRLRIAQVIRDVEAQRVADLRGIQKGLSSIATDVTKEAEAHRDITAYLLSAPKQK